MDLFFVDAVIGSKYYAIIRGRVREVFFLGTEGIVNTTHFEYYYCLDVAGIGFIKIQYTEINTDYGKWSQGLTFDSILTESVDDFLEKKYVQARFFSRKVDDCIPMFCELIPQVHWGIYETPWAFSWNDEYLRPQKKEIGDIWTWHYDHNGFTHDINLSNLYFSEQECLYANADKFKPISF